MTLNLTTAFAQFVVTLPRMLADPDLKPSAILVRGQATSPSASPPNVLDSFQKHMQQFQNCLDQAIAKTVDEVNVKQVQPVFQVVGDQLNRFSKAFEDLTATKPPV